jgi:hypothetical protein
LYYQPYRFSDTNSKEKRHPWDYIVLLTFLSVVPISLAGASGALAAPPSYYTDRDFMMVVIACFWLVGPLLMRALAMTLGKGDHESQALMWRVVAIKDVVIAMSIVIALSAITCGAGGTCKMWSGYYHYGRDGAQIPLITTAIYHWNGYVLYPALVSVCIGWNIAVFFGIRYIGCCSRFLHSRYSSAGRYGFDVLVWRNHEIQSGLRDEEHQATVRS